MIIKNLNYMIPSDKTPSKLNILYLLILIAFGSIALVYFKESPTFIIYLIQYLFIVYIFFSLKKYILSFLLFLYPLFKFLVYQTYDSDWNTVGDLYAYVGLLLDAFSANGVNLDTIQLAHLEYNKFYFLTIINMYFPMTLFETSYTSNNNFILLYFNDLILLVITTFIVTALKGIMKDKYILYFVFFVFFSPTILALTWIPDRHLFTLLGLMLFIRGNIEWKNTRKLSNFYLFSSVVIIFLNKPPLLLAIGLMFLFSEFKSSKYKSTLFPFFFISLVLLFYLTQNIVLSYAVGVGSDLGYGAASLLKGNSLLTWIFMVPIKYIYAILSPFPWYKFNGLISNAGGSYFIVIMMYLNSVLGLSIVIALIKYYKKIKKYSFWYDNFIWVGIIFSLTIIMAHIGHAGYLSIYYILFLPIFFILGKRISIYIFAISFLFIVLLNIILYLFKF